MNKSQRCPPMGEELNKCDINQDIMSSCESEVDDLSKRIENILSVDYELNMPESNDFQMNQKRIMESCTLTEKSTPFLSKYEDINVGLQELETNINNQNIQLSDVSYEYFSSASFYPQRISYEQNESYEPEMKFFNEKNPDVLNYQQYIHNIEEHVYLNMCHSDESDHSVLKDDICDFEESSILPESSSNQIKSPVDIESVKSKDPSYFKKKNGNTSDSNEHNDPFPESDLPENMPLNPRIRWYPCKSFNAEEDIQEAGTQTSYEDFELGSTTNYICTVYPEICKISGKSTDRFNNKAADATELHNEDIFSSDFHASSSSDDTVCANDIPESKSSDKNTQTPLHSTDCYYHRLGMRIYIAACDILNEMKPREYDIMSDEYSRKSEETLKVMSASATYKNVCHGDEVPFELVQNSKKCQISFPSLECDCIEKITNNFLELCVKHLTVIKERLDILEYLDVYDQYRIKPTKLSEENMSNVELPKTYESTHLELHKEIIYSRFNKLPSRNKRASHPRSWCHYGKRIRRKKEKDEKKSNQVVLRIIYRQKAKLYSKSLAKYAVTGVVNHPLHKHIV